MHDICSHSSIFYFFARSIHVHQLKGDIHFNQINLEMSKILPCQSEHANWWVIICFSPLVLANWELAIANLYDVSDNYRGDTRETK